MSRQMAHTAKCVSNKKLQDYKLLSGKLRTLELCNSEDTYGVRIDN